MLLSVAIAVFLSGNCVAIEWQLSGSWVAIEWPLCGHWPAQGSLLKSRERFLVHLCEKRSYVLGEEEDECLLLLVQEDPPGQESGRS